jgi:hypothetical protein
MNDPKVYDASTHEVPFLDSGIRCRLIASALTSTGTGKSAVNFMVKVSEGQEGIDATSRTKTSLNSKVGVFQQSLSTEGSVALTLNTLRTFGWKGTDLAEVNKTPEENGMTEEVAITSENDTYGGKSRVKVKFVNKVDMSLKDESIAALNSTYASLIQQSLKGPLQVKRAAPVAVPGRAPPVGPPSRDTTGSPAGAAAEDDVPF